MDDGVAARIDAIKILNRLMDTSEFPDRMMVGVPPFRRGFVMDLVYTTLRNVRALDFVIEPMISREPQSHSLAALYLGSAQILKMPSVAEHAAVHATVEAIKELDGKFVANFVNAILRNILRQLPAIQSSLDSSPIAIRESHLEEQVERWEKEFGLERTEEICKWDNLPANITAITIHNGPDVNTLLENFKNHGVEATLHPGRPEFAINIPHGSHAENLPGFSEGLFSIQDPATIESIKLLDVKPGMFVLDACASPGGKSVQIGKLLENSGHLVSMDCWDDRLEPLEENIRRFGLSEICKIMKGDIRSITLKELGGKKFDRILLDVPCSNTGGQRRRADSRWRFSADRLEKLNDTQMQILENASTLLASHGRIVYSTCSLEKEENLELIKKFVKKSPKFTIAEYVQNIPPDNFMDGAFAAAIEMR